MRPLDQQIQSKLEANVPNSWGHTFNRPLLEEALINLVGATTVKLPTRDG